MTSGSISESTALNPCECRFSAPGQAQENCFCTGDDKWTPGDLKQLRTPRRTLTGKPSDSDSPTEGGQVNGMPFAGPSSVFSKIQPNSMKRSHLSLSNLRPRVLQAR